jgi:hypothetical protein
MDVLRRYDEGRAQNYQTHNEVARLIGDLISAKLRVNVYSLVTQERKEDRFAGNSRIISLGATDYSDKGLLSAAIFEDKVESIVAHYPSSELLYAALATNSRIFPVLANSENGTGLRSWFRKRRMASLFNNPRFELISNHCFPATEQLAHSGVRREKLIAWDIARPFDPASRAPKTLNMRPRLEAFYAGSISRAKGIADFDSCYSIATGAGHRSALFTSWQRRRRGNGSAWRIARSV